MVESTVIRFRDAIKRSRESIETDTDRYGGTQDPFGGNDYQRGVEASRSIADQCDSAQTKSLIMTGAALFVLGAAIGSVSTILWVNFMMEPLLK